MTVETLPQLLAQSVATYSERMAFRAPWNGALESITFAELGLRAAGAAEALASDVHPGEFVLLGAPNSLPWVIAFYGILVRGAVPVPVDTEMPDEALTAIVAELRPAAVIGDDEFLERVGELRTRRISVEEVHDWPESEAPLAPAGGPDPDSVALLLYTGGTTGHPKGVMLSHRNMLAGIEATVDAAGIVDDDVLFVVLPLFHVFPLTTGCLTPMAAGIPAELEYRLLRVASRAAETPPTIFLGVPALFETLLRQVERNAHGGVKGAYFKAARGFNTFLIRSIGVNLGRLLFRPVHQALGGRLRFMVSGGARLDPAVHRGMMAIGLPVIQGYGLSEAAPVVTGQRFIGRDYWWRARRYWGQIGSVGWPLLNVEIAIEPDEHSEPGEGELVVRAPNVMMGYYQRPADTARVLRDGTLHTGDLARIDSRGHVWITGRASLVISMPNGKQVNLETFEADLLEAAEIAQIRLTVEQEPHWQLVATVFPSADALAPGDITDADRLQRVIRDAVRRESRSLPSWLRVDEVRLTDEPFPVTRLGKLRRVERSEHAFDFERWQGHIRALVETA
ncbi:MAG: AMP-binding protein [Chloroflexi bacterium]|nr:AMP-binding protein [Chloroflexota bacterium]MDA1145239.1 AMP-binding protein [Chloroflexota bacterium]